MTVSIPVGTVPGEIPIPVAFTMNASALNFGKASDFSASYTMFGTVGFGYIGFCTGPGNLIVLENGQNLSPQEFAPYTSGTYSTYGSRLLAAYGASATGTPSKTLLSSDGSLLWATYTSANLPTSLKNLITLAAGFPTGTTPPDDSYWGANLLTAGNFEVIADKQLLRVYQDVPMPNGEIVAVPVLWLDRFTRTVKFVWERSTVGLPAGISSVMKVTATNEHKRGVVVRWANGQEGLITRPLLDLLRADFVGTDGPSLLVSGYAGCGNQPAGISNTLSYANPINLGGLVALPETLQLGPSADLRQPSWNGLNPVAQGPTSGTSGGEPLQTWSFAYDTGKDQIDSIQDPMGIKTTFNYAKSAIQPSNLQNGIYREVVWGVTQATQEDLSGKSTYKHTTTWTRTLPANDGTSWTQPNWTVAVKDWWNHGGTGTSDRTLTLTYASPTPNGKDFDNGFLMSSVLTDTAGNTWSTTTHTSVSGVGLDGSLSQPVETRDTRSGEAPRREVISYTDSSSLQVAKVESYGSQGGAYYKFQDRQYTYNNKWPMLESQQVTQMLASRYYYPTAETSTYSYVWDSGDFLQLSRSYFNASSAYQHGTIRTYDGWGRLATEGVWHLENSTTQSVSPKTLTYHYDSNGLQDMVTTQYADFTTAGAATTSTLARTVQAFDGGARPTSVTGEDGVTTTYAYDLWGRPLLESRPGTLKVVITYPDTWTVTRTQGSLVTTTRLDGFGRQLSQDLPGGATLSYDYDLHGRPTRTTKTYAAAPTSPASSTTYDLLDRPLTQTDFAGVQTIFTYSFDSAGNNLVSRMFGDGSCPTTTATNCYGLQVREALPSGDQTARYYDKLGNVTTILTSSPVGGNQSRTFTYDLLGRLVTRTDPETGTQSFSNFNALNQPGTLVEASTSSAPRTRTLTRDGLGRTRSVGSTYNGTTVAEAFTYAGTRLTDASNTVTGTANYAVSQHYDYLDPASGGFLHAESTTQSGQVSSISYGYSNLGAVNRIQYPSGRIVDYLPDDLGRIVKVNYRQNADPSSPEIAIVKGSSFEPWGNRMSLIYASDAQDAWSPDASGTRMSSWILSPKVGSPLPWSYAYEPATGRLKGTGEWGWTNDSLGRLQAVTQGWGFAQTAGTTFQQNVNPITASFAFDGFGNNVRSNAASLATLPAAMNNFTFAASLPTNALPASTATSPSGLTNASYASNGDGELLGVNTGVSSAPALSMTWDPLGRLASVYQSQTGATEGYAYAPSGLRVSRSDTLDPVQNRLYGYTSGGQLLTEFSLPNAAQMFKGVSSSGTVFGPTSSTHGGLQAARVWHMNSTKSSITHYLAYLIPGDVVTATVWVNAPAGSQGCVVLENGYETETSNFVSRMVTGTGTWQQVTVNLTITGGMPQYMKIVLYGNTNLQTANGTFTLYDDLQASSVAKGVVFTEGFEGGLSLADSTAGWVIRGNADILTSSSATTFSGQGAVRMLHGPASSNAIWRPLGTFASGHTLTASLWMEAAAGVQYQITMGYMANAVSTTVTGTGAWQNVTLSFTLNATIPVTLIITGKTDATNSYTGYSYLDEVTVADSGVGLILQEGFEAGLSSAWSKSGTVTNINNLDARDVVYLDGRAIAEIDGSGVHELHGDHLGTPRVVTKASTGAVEGIQTYGPYGEAIQAAGYVPATGYTGHLQTEPNGLIYMRGRFYSPAWHVFLNSDHGADPHQLNQFAYCGGNPMAMTDPSGMFSLGDALDPLGVVQTISEGKNPLNPLKSLLKIASNGLKIATSPFRGDFDQIVSKAFWEAPQEGLGILYAEMLNSWNQVDSVDFRGGATLVDLRNKTPNDPIINFLESGITQGGAITIGSVITAPYGTNINSMLFMHEYGHYLQSQSMGPRWIFWGIDSFNDSRNNNKFPDRHYQYSVERDADQRSINYFNLPLTVDQFIEQFKAHQYDPPSF